VNLDTTRCRTSAFGLSVAFAVLTACSSDPASPTIRVDGASLAKAAPGVGVTASNPNIGHDGDASLVVTITGSGFVSGAQTAWER